ncbi:hypothetical protein Psch_02936 [Pelotomaculum schinkii]|uniref:Uncharacterized protein n=1 Tax=Pelotomaculum schinkii TaxID=78350 RepID=A0A4Y7RAB1_9FIRM|nr:hypothetical protein [Pelotomaculum schinkii]TEB05894.1 hypothetical protein Psch_02936 [Pelotomaculum schinkii]
MTLGDSKEYIAADDAALEKKGYVMVLRNKKDIQLVKVTYWPESGASEGIPQVVPDLGNRG